MCGFAGEFVFDRGRADQALARRMAARLVHRGPDEEGSFLSRDGRCAIGFRRLAVIDPSGSHQPMTCPDGRVTIVHNGEIYNFRELRDELSRQGLTFSSAGDAEVLLTLYLRDGPGMLRRLTGMFAFAIYDASSQRLMLARDRLGEKPLLYAPLPDRVVFASEPKALLEHPDVSRQTDPAAIILYLTVGYIPCPQSAWRAVRKLPPAHVLVVEGPCPAPQRYWAPQRVPLPADRGEALACVRESVTRAVSGGLVSDVPLGALLSGGVDSSIVVALMARQAGAAGGVRTFTAGFDDAEYDERPHAARVARHCGTEHTELLVAPSVTDAMRRIVEVYDEPFADSSALPTWLVCQAARQHVTVALTGDGGDEVFGGYDRYRALHLAERMGPFGYSMARVAGTILRLFAGTDERSAARRFVEFADSLPCPYAVQYLRYRSLFSAADLGVLLDEDFTRATEASLGETWFCDLYERGDCSDEVERAQRHDLNTYLPDDLLVKTDRASMACSLELRAPLLNHEVVSLGLSLPTEMKVSARRGKIALREAFAELLPSDILARKKRGFGVPLGRWLREDLRQAVRDSLSDKALMGTGIFRPGAAAALGEAHISGLADHRHRLWALLVLAGWLGKR